MPYRTTITVKMTQTLEHTEPVPPAYEGNFPDARGWAATGVQTTTEPVVERAGDPNHIAWEWIMESNDVGGVDAGDLASRLERAGFTCPEDLEDH